MVVHRRCHAILRVVVVRGLLYAHGVGVGRRERIECAVLGIELAGRVDVVTSAVEHGVVKLACIHGRNVMRELLLDCWDEFIDDRVQEASVCDWHLNVGGVGRQSSE
jgi:hypothetical protein